jgi:hypothetical protein
MNTPTPRTDAEAGTLIDADEVVPADFARGLERELAHEREKSERYRLVTLKLDAELAAEETVALAHWNKELKRAMKAEAELAAERENAERYRLATLKLDAELTAEREKVRVLRLACERLRDCDWVISLPDRMDAVRDIARAALAATEDTGTPKISRTEDIELINGIHKLADMIELYAKNITCNK